MGANWIECFCVIHLSMILQRTKQNKLKRKLGYRCIFRVFVDYFLEEKQTTNNMWKAPHALASKPSSLVCDFFYLNANCDSLTHSPTKDYIATHALDVKKIMLISCVIKLVSHCFIYSRLRFSLNKWVYTSIYIQPEYAIFFLWSS